MKDELITCRKYRQESWAYTKAKQRCCNPNDPQYHYYGGRGIEFRFNSFTEFFEVIGAKPSRKHSLDRIDVNGHYEKDNVRWATMKEQNRNKRRSLAFTINGTKRPLIEWCELYGIHYQTVYSRLCRQMPIERALNILYEPTGNVWIGS